MATKEQLRKIRQKYHLGEYRNSKKSHHVKGVKMAKRKHYSRKSGGFTSGVWGSIVGVGIFTLLYEPFVSPMVPLSEPTKSLVELGVGLVFMNNKNNMIKNTARAAVIINAYQLMALYVKPMILGQTSSAF